MTNNRNESIIEKIKGLLALANDHKNDEECQTAFIMAQKLMIKYDISSSQVEETKENNEEIEKSVVTVYKTLFWWERMLASIISKNFRVTNYTEWIIKKGEKRKKRRVMFLGYEKDVALAKEMYILAYDVLTHYTKNFVEQHYTDTNEKRNRGNTERLKNSYIQGFLNGLKEKFEDQISEMREEYGLVLLTPVKVQEAYDKKFEGKPGLPLTIPSIEERKAYEQGFHDGKKVDYTKSTIDGNFM